MAESEAANRSWVKPGFGLAVVVAGVALAWRFGIFDLLSVLVLGRKRDLESTKRGRFMQNCMLRLRGQVKYTRRRRERRDFIEANYQQEKANHGSIFSLYGQVH